MADPHHLPDLDAFDRAGVRLYRAGLCLSALVLWALAASYALADGSPHGAAGHGLWLAYAAAVVLSTHHLHIYMKQFRWLIGASSWLGLLLLAAAWGLGPTGPHVSPASEVGYVGYGIVDRLLLAGAVGFLAVALSAFALKEQFCFKIPLQRLVPLSLIALVVMLLVNQPLGAAVALTVAAVAYSVLAVSKLRMPLHYDIGDKSKYQV